MKLAVIFLSVFVAISQQQNYHQLQHQYPWLSPKAQETSLNDYPGDYLNYDDISPYVRHHFNPAEPVNFFGNTPVPLAYHDSINEDYYPYYVLSSYDDFATRYRPSSLQPPQQFYFGSLGTGNSFPRPFLQTVTFTITSTVTAAVIQSCVPANQFNAAPPPACRRKRDEIAGSLDEDAQFSINPSEAQPLVVTERPSTQMRDDRQLLIDEADPQGIRSSQAESIPRGITGIGASSDKSLREKRFFFNQFVATTTVVSYVIQPTVVTSTVNLGAAGTGGAGTGQIVCLPAGYIVCA